MDLSIIIISWKVKEKLRANLQALFDSQGDFSYEVFVVDNNSGDGSTSMIKEEFPKVKLITNTENVGFARANNQAIKQCTGDYILLLNPDMLVNHDTLIKSLTWAKNNQQATVSSCRLVNDKGETIKHVRRFPTLFDQLMVILKVPHFLPFVLNRYLYSNFNYDKESKVDSVRGAFFLINKKVWTEISNQPLPLLDERYFIWFEEVDFCKQVYQNGGEVWYSPAATCLDYIGASFGQVAVNTKQKYFEESMLKYFKKWKESYQVFIIKSAWSLTNFIMSKLAKK
jgi:O-antigen biosynthesis protein